MLFNFQGALSACPVSRDSLYIISLRFCFVKGFLKVFSNFFQPLVSARRIAQSDPYIISLRVPFVKRFFNFFEVFCGSFWNCFPLADSSDIILHSHPFCQYLFAKFFEKYWIFCLCSFFRRLRGGGRREVTISIGEVSFPPPSCAVRNSPSTHSPCLRFRCALAE